MIPAALAIFVNRAISLLMWAANCSGELEYSIVRRYQEELNRMPQRQARCAALMVSGALLAAFLFRWPSALAADPADVKVEPVAIVDTHAHIVANARHVNPAAMVSRALSAMDQYRVEKTVLLPPPFPSGHAGIYGRRELEPIARANPGRFAFAAGGESLNPIIQSVAPDKVTPEMMREFQQEAEAIVKAGAVGFGELAAEHFSSGRGNHPYESVHPDHPLLLALADIAARHNMPIDLHMEAVPQDMLFPARRAGGRNPENLRENISGLERLLEHNRNARIVWAHAGWDLTRERTVPLMRSLLEKHPNLYMSVKLSTRGPHVTSPFNQYGELRPGWLAMLREFPDRFLIGSDQFFDEGEPELLPLTRKFIDALPLDLARQIARENAMRIYRLDIPAR